MVKFSRKSLSLSSFWVSSHEQPRDFFTSCLQAGDSATPMLLIRLILASVALSILVWSFNQDRSVYYLVFLTNWGLILLNLTLLSGVLVSIVAASRQEDYNSEELPWFISLHWLLNNFTPTICLLITVLYWTLIHDPNSIFEQPLQLYWLDVTTHAFNSCLIMLELVFSRTPMYLMHFYQPAALGLGYTIFTYVFYKLGGTVNGNHFIYAVLDWSDPAATNVIVVVSFIGLLAIYACLCGVVHVRNVLSSGFTRSQSMDLPSHGITDTNYNDYP